MAVRVLHLITRFINGGGAESTVENTLAGLDESGEYDVRLGFGAEFDESRVSRVRDRGIEARSFNLLRHFNPITSSLAVGQIASYLRREHIDVIHTHSTEAGIVGRWAGTIARTPVIIHEIEGDPITDDRNTILNAIILGLERISAPCADRLIAKSARTRDTFIDRGIGKPEQYEIVYHGIALDEFEAADAAVLPNSSGEYRILFVGRLEEGKGIRDLIQAFKPLRSQFSVDLLLAGDGPLREDLENEIRARGLEDSVHLLGFRRDVPALIAASDIFVLPSYREGTPRVITEALAGGLPVVSTNIAGIPEQVRDGKTGFLFEPGAVSDLTDRLRELLSSSTLRAEMGARGRDSVDRFSIESSKRRYLEIYRELLEGKRE